MTPLHALEPLTARVRNLWAYRYFVASSVRNELVASLTRSRLGIFWLFAQPLSLVIIYTLILSNVLSAKLPGVEGQYAYAIYLTSGIFAWTLFSDGVSRGTTLFIDSADLMKKLSFPRVALPAVMLGTMIVQNFLFLLVALGVFLLLGHSFSLAMLWVPVLMILFGGFGAGIGLACGALNVFIRDVGQLIPILLQFAFWFTPIVYPITIIPEAYQGLYDLNIMYWFVSAYHDTIVYGRVPDVTHLLVMAVACLVAVLVAGFFFRRASPEMVDVL